MSQIQESKLRNRSKIYPFFPAKSVQANKQFSTFTFADFYAGIGGFHLAFHDLNARCVMAVEKDKHARQTYERNFRNISPKLFERGYFFRDVNELAEDPTQIPDFDILCAGFPCQSFSVAGKRGGFFDPRNGEHFFLLARIIEAKRPLAFFLENVRGLLSIDNGRAFQTIQNTLTELGYSFHWKIIRACDFGLPQIRQRIFMVGFRNPEIPFRIPRPVPLQMTMSDIFDAWCERNIGFTLRASGRRAGIHSRWNWDCYLVDGKERYLTSREARKMQGFPDWFRFPVSECQAMQQLGNSITVPAVRAVAAEILRSLAGTGVTARSFGKKAA